MSVHIEHLYTAMQEFMNEQRRTVNEHIRDPKQFEEGMKKAQDKFKEFCVTNGLDVDFTPR